ncbi:hypothetical protein NA56DRAFT_711506 [Hyaloscypha hepaticicola]|uniref:Uncharacterized protein n=1 Tax=Hyaloscypha hepaticicola TaxID=2082293 RepID=A0A2J6PIK6_9HELO|nr:hypothetical protein NA56DRAFT_711506 [Hyaloscypha hepaticicola]
MSLTFSPWIYRAYIHAAFVSTQTPSIEQISDDADSCCLSPRRTRAVGNQETASTVGGADRTKQEHLRSIRGIIQEEIEPQFEDRLGRQQARRLCLPLIGISSRGGKLHPRGRKGSIYTPALSVGFTCLVDIRLFVICTKHAISTTWIGLS